MGALKEHDRNIPDKAICPPVYVVNRAETGPPCAYPGQDEYIMFTRQDSKWVINPHNDAFVIIARVANKNLHKVLVNTGASYNLFEYSVLKKMKLDKDLEPVSASIYGITGGLDKGEWDAPITYQTRNRAQNGHISGKIHSGGYKSQA